MQCMTVGCKYTRILLSQLSLRAHLFLCHLQPSRRMTALLNFSSLLLSLLLLVCTCTYIRSTTPRLLDRNRHGYAHTVSEGHDLCPIVFWVCSGSVHGSVSHLSVRWPATSHYHANRGTIESLCGGVLRPNELSHPPRRRQVMDDRRQHCR